MIVPVLAATAVGVCAAWFLLLALLGRSGFPPRERVPLRSWRRVDVLANARHGRSCVIELETARRRPPASRAA